MTPPAMAPTFGPLFEFETFEEVDTAAIVGSATQVVSGHFSQVTTDTEHFVPAGQLGGHDGTTLSGHTTHRCSGLRSARGIGIVAT
jgi:hypothetical protein